MIISLLTDQNEKVLKMSHFYMKGSKQTLDRSEINNRQRSAENEALCSFKADLLNEQNRTFNIVSQR